MARTDFEVQYTHRWSTSYLQMCEAVRFELVEANQGIDAPEWLPVGSHGHCTHHEYADILNGRQDPVPSGVFRS